MTTKSAPSSALLWPAILTAASVLTTLALACATPFAALAAIAAVRMPRRQGVTLMIAAWAASQAVGFCALGYPRDPKTIAWGAAIGVAAVASLLAAAWVDRRAGSRPAWARVAIGYVVAAVAYKAALLLAALGLGGVATALSPHWFARQFVRDAAILAGLLALHRGLVAVGVPALPRPATA